MPLSSVLGAQSLVKPGVCTSSTRPASPFEGQTIYETDTDLVRSYNGTSWVTVGPTTVTTPGLVLITSKTSFSNVGSVSLTTNTFSSSYTNYRIMFSITDVAANASITLRFRASGSDLTSGYYWGVRGLSSVGGSMDANADAGTSFTLGYAATSYDLTSFWVDLFSPQASEVSRLAWGGYSWNSGYTGTGVVNGAGTLITTTAYDSVSFIGSSNITGHYTVYGYNQ